jgi:diguanylate cyclase (GGDEF)-like protein
MYGPAISIEEMVPARSFRAFLTEQLRTVLEDRAVRVGVIGILLILSSLFSLLSMPAGIDSGWLFIVPVAISAIASGLKGGLLVAFLSSSLCAAYAVAGAGSFEPEVFVSVVSARFALYGLAAVVLGAFAEAHQSLQSNLRYLADLDPLTKVSNVARFYEELGLLEQAKTTSFAVLLIDIDDLKTWNDRYGHQTGSAAILMVANTLRRLVRMSDCVARFGGDEFVVILKDADRAGAQIVINRLRNLLAGESLPGAAGGRVSVSAGVSLFGEDGVTSDELLASADLAMYEDKRRRKAALAG